jgi:hypothetical protein
MWHKGVYEAQYGFHACNSDHAAPKHGVSSKPMSRTGGAHSDLSSREVPSKQKGESSWVGGDGSELPFAPDYEAGISRVGGD